MNFTGLDAFWAGLFAAVVTYALTPLTARLAVRLGAVDQPRGRGLSERPTPLLGGLAIFAGGGSAIALWLLGGHKEWSAILWGAAIITAGRAPRDLYHPPAPRKLPGRHGGRAPPVR